MSTTLHEIASSNPTVVLVPGLDGTALLFYRQIPLLAERFNVAAFPLPDHPAKSMGDLVEDLRELVEQVAGDEVILCGESFGGALIMSFALAYPDHVQGLVVINSFPVLRGVRKRVELRVGPRVLRLFPWAAMPVVRRLTEAKLHSPHTLPEDLAEFHERAKSIGREGYIRRVEILRHYDIQDRLQEIKCPTLFIAGDRDKLIPSVREAHFMASRVPNASLQILEGYGHICLINHDLNLLDYVQPWYEAELALSPGQEPQKVGLRQNPH